MQQAAIKGRKSKCGCAGRREGDSQTQSLLQNALECHETAWKQGDGGYSSPTLPRRVFWRCLRGSLWASELPSCAVWQGLPRRHIWAPVLLLERVPGITFLYSFMHVWHILTKMDEHSMFYHSIPNLFFAAYFLMLPLKFFAVFAFLADKNPRFPICFLLGWLYGSNEGQQPQVWT